MIFFISITLIGCQTAAKRPSYKRTNSYQSTALRSANLLKNKAIQQYKKKDYQGAVQLLKQSIGKKETEGAVYYMARSYYELKAYQKAEEYFLKLQRLSKDKAAVLHWLGWCAVKLQNYEKAVQLFNQTTEFRNNAYDYDGLGYAYGKIGNLDASLMAYKQYLKMKPNDANPLNRLGWTYLELHQFEQAVHHFEKSLQLQKNTYSLIGLGAAYGMLGNQYEAAKRFDIAKRNADENQLRQIKFHSIEIALYHQNYQKALDIIGKKPFLGMAIYVKSGLLLVKSVNKNSPSYFSGIRKGDVLVRCNSTDLVPSVKDFLKLVNSFQYQDQVQFEVLRNGRIIKRTVVTGISHDMKRVANRVNREKVQGSPSVVVLQSKPATVKPVAAPLDYRNKWALVVGISEYEHSGDNGLSNLVFADDDARAFAKTLKDKGWSSSHIKLLINQKATHRNIMIALESWLSKAKPDDQIVLFWAGHGYPDPEDPEKVYFATYDTDINIPATGYRMDKVRTALAEQGAKNVIVFADTCHAGKIVTRGDRALSITKKLRSMAEQKRVPNGWVFMVGADSDRQSVEHSSWSNGAFTHVLLKGLKGAADGFQGMGVNDGVVTMGELRAYLQTMMPQETQKVLGTAKHPLITTSSGDPTIWKLTVSY